VQPSGTTTRAATSEDAQAIYELIADCERDLDGLAEIDLDDVVSDLARPGTDLAQDSLLVYAGGGELVGCALVFKRDRADVQVRPTHRGRGIGTFLLGWTEARAVELGSTEVGQTVTDNDALAAALLTAHGYAPKDTAWILEIELPSEPTVPALPEGYAMRMFEPGRDDEETYLLIEDAFGEWPGRRPSTYDEWVAFSIGRETFVPSLSPLVIARDPDVNIPRGNNTRGNNTRGNNPRAGERIVGAALVLDYPKAAEGYVHQLAVHRDHRHRGLARALLRYAFRDAFRQGRRTCVLSTNSYTGALSLYERVGMRIRRAYTNRSKPLR
jgi:ribosomal protein S18 acetylase RimI-like enzyme